MVSSRVKAKECAVDYNKGKGAVVGQCKAKEGAVAYSKGLGYSKGSVGYCEACFFQKPINHCITFEFTLFTLFHFVPICFHLNSI